MWHEVAFFGVLLPGLLPIFIGSLLLMWVLDALIGRFDGYRYAWHPALLRLALFVCLFSAAGLLLH